MARLTNSKSVLIDNGGVLTLAAGDYAFNFTNNKNFIQVEQENGQTTNLRASEFQNVSKIVVGQDTNVTLDFSRLGDIDIDFQANGGVNLTGITFTTADAASDFKFEPVQKLDDIVSELIQERGITGTIEALTINGNKADAFKVIWDHLDDNYSYYNTAINDAFIDLGIAYAKYLKAGGEALTDTIVKYAPDAASDADSTPERSQTLHDNILGNFDEGSITDRFSKDNSEGDDVIFQRIQDAGLGELIGVIGNLADGRPIYGGYDNQDPTPTRTWDADFFGL
jgi:hypothetical protein